MDIFNDFDKIIGETIDTYKIKRKIGNGSIGVVFLAEDSEANIERAIKIIPKAHIDARENWEQEIKKSNLIQSVGGVVQYIKHGQTSLEGDEFIYIVWQYINSESLKSVIETGNITIQILIDVIECALNVFDACKEVNIQHSDFHSGNILVAYPSTLGLDRNTRKIWITDFGYGTFSNEKPPLEDYKGLARIIQDSIEKISRNLLEREDRIKHNALKNEFPKYLFEESTLEGDYVKNPIMLWEELQRLFVVPDKATNNQKSVGDYLAAEFIGDRWDEWESLFVPKFLGANELFDKNICVLTGLRGCGKTMMFKRLSTQLVEKLGPTGVTGEDSFICFYLNARSIAEAFPWLPETEEIAARNQVINFFHLKWTIEILQWLKYEIIKNNYKNRDIAWLIDFLKYYFTGPMLYLTSKSPVGIIDNIIYKCNEELSKSKLFGNYNTSIVWPFSDIDYLEKLLNAISSNTSFSKNKSFYMLLDDYSTPLVTETTQRILNPIIFRRCPDVFFKISTESTESLLRIGLNGKTLEEEADFKLVELGMITINCDIQERRNIISDIFNRRVTRSKLFAGRNLDLKMIIGDPDITEVDRALQIGKNEKVVYFGFDVFCNMWSSDLRELIKIFSEMVSEEGEKAIQYNIDQNITPIISSENQNRVFRQAGGRFLHALSIVTNPFKKRHVSTGGQIEHEYGKKLYAIVTAFQEISYFVLKNKTSKNQKSKPPKQARKIELTTDIEKLDDESRELYRGLIRYGVFIKDHRGKSIRGSVSAVRLFLRSLLIPFCTLTFSKRDNISFEWEDFNEFLRNPETFKKECIKKIASQLRREETKTQQNELFSTEEKLYVTTDDIE